MFRNVYQKNFLSIFYSIGQDPLHNWCITTKHGYAKRIYDEDIKSLVFEMLGANVCTTFMSTPRESNIVLGIKLPFLVLLVKNLCKYFSFEIKIWDDQRFGRRFRVSNFQSKTTVQTFSTSMAMGLSPGWNQINFNLADFTRRAYGTNYIETLRVQINANVRIRRIYFCDRLMTEDELPNEFRLVPKQRERKRPVTDFNVPAARPPSPVKSIMVTPNADTMLSESEKETNPVKAELSETFSKKELVKFYR